MLRLTLIVCSIAAKSVAFGYLCLNKLNLWKFPAIETAPWRHPVTFRPLVVPAHKSGHLRPFFRDQSPPPQNSFASEYFSPAKAMPELVVPPRRTSGRQMPLSQTRRWLYDLVLGLGGRCLFHQGAAGEPLGDRLPRCRCICLERHWVQQSCLGRRLAQSGFLILREGLAHSCRGFRR